MNKTFFDGIYVEKETLKEAGIEYPIKLEYFKTTQEDKEDEKAFGIQIVKTEYKKEVVEIETKEIKNITTNEGRIDYILTKFKDNEVTPIGADDIIEELEK